MYNLIKGGNLTVTHFLYPKDLAVEVDSYLMERNINSKLTIENLTNLFEIMYFASLKTEESEPIRVKITLIDKETPDPNPPKRIRRERWSYVRFKQEIELNIQNLVKLSKAADPKASSLAVDVSNGSLVIWGMIDQEYHYYNCLLNERESGPQRPGIFEATIESLGEISIYKDYYNIASLKKNILTKKQNNVFYRGPISEKVDAYMQDYIHSVKNAIDPETYQSHDFWDRFLKRNWISIICRILINIKEYRHGGAVLITLGPVSSQSDLSVKYDITYDRLSTSLPEYAIGKIKHREFLDYIIEEAFNKKNENIPYPIINKGRLIEYDTEEYSGGLTGAVKFVAALSCVDGLVLLDQNLTVNGFGVEITTNEEPQNVYLAHDEEASEEKLKELEYKHYGTRHRSMMRYCYKHPDSVGFVISQDGDIRAITNVDNKLIIWDNIKLAQFLRSNI